MISARDYVPQMGNVISNSANSLAQTLATLPETLRQNTLWKQEVANTKSETDFKLKLANGLKSSLQSLGIDPNSVILPDPSNTKIGIDDFTKQIGNALAPHIENGTITPDKIQSLSGVMAQPNVKEAVQTQRVNAGFEAMYKQLAPQQPGVAMPGSSPVPQQPTDMNNRLSMPDGSNIVQDGAGFDQSTIMGASPAKPEMPAVSAQDQMTNDIFGRIKTLYDNKSIDPTLALQMMMEAKSGADKIKLAEIKAESDRTKEGKNKAGESIITGANAGRNVFKDGQPTDSYSPSDVMTNPDAYSLDTGELASKLKTSGGRGGRYGVAKDADLMSQYDKLVGNVKAFYGPDGLIDPSFEKPAQESIQMANIVRGASVLQSRAGGRDILDNDTALQKTEELYSMRDAIEKTLPLTRNIVNLPYPMARAGNEDILKNADKFFGTLKSSNPSGYNKIITALKDGKSLESILQAINDMGL